MPRPPRFAVASALLATLTAVLLAGCGTATPGNDSGRTAVPLPPATGTSQPIAEKNLVYLWPFTVDHGMIECRGKNQTVFVSPDGKAYALNREATQAGFPDVDPLRRDGTGGAKVSLGAIRSHALALCPPA
ncbi:hypothetical protein [Frankia sp. R82]|uniref:hypothetical protein n=1 Tax=Frankia sp. R82 TaxID=2950553 RepID=UPI0020442F93|nr:hypothetical protein [Frankia sp. R82]MCM3886091.1 hypothetical protein [Frankia sp. R82]